MAFGGDFFSAFWRRRPCCPTRPCLASGGGRGVGWAGLFWGVGVGLGWVGSGGDREGCAAAFGARVLWRRSLGEPRCGIVWRFRFGLFVAPSVPTPVSVGWAGVDWGGVVFLGFVQRVAFWLGGGFLSLGGFLVVLVPRAAEVFQLCWPCPGFFLRCLSWCALLSCRGSVGLCVRLGAGQ